MNDMNINTLNVNMNYMNKNNMNMNNTDINRNALDFKKRHPTPQMPLKITLTNISFLVPPPEVTNITTANNS